jgi:cytoskeletal protein CcmA (bactofilin family)
MLRKKPTAAAPLSAAELMAGGRGNGSAATFSVLAADIAIVGDVRARADLHVDGRIEGDVDCAALVQGEASEIVGAIRADSARLAGTVRGSIAAGSLVILKSARIEGDVSYDALTIEQGAAVDGRFAHRVAAPVSSPDEAEPVSLLG